MTKDTETQNMTETLTDGRIGTVMMHPVFGEITITDVREVPDRTIAYYEGSFCNMNILTESRKK